MVQQSKVQLSRFPTTRQSNHPKSNYPDFQACNVRFMEKVQWPIKASVQLKDLPWFKIQGKNQSKSEISTLYQWSHKIYYATAVIRKSNKKAVRLIAQLIKFYKFDYLLYLNKRWLNSQ